MSLSRVLVVGPPSQSNHSTDHWTWGHLSGAVVSDAASVTRERRPGSGSTHDTRFVVLT